MKRNILCLFFLIVLIIVPVACIDIGSTVDTLMLDSRRGKCVEGGCNNGDGTYVYDTGTKEIGKFENSQLIEGKRIWAASGKGNFPDGLIEEGKFENLMIVKGKWVFPNGEIWDGIFNASVFTEGTVTYSNGMTLYAYGGELYESQDKRWKYLIESVHDDYIFYDTETLDRDERYFRMWKKSYHPSNKDKVFKYLDEHDCQSGKKRVLQWITYPDGQKDLTPSEWRNVIPDSIEEYIHKTFCANNK